MARKKTISRRVANSSVWQSLNEPIAHPTQDFVNTVFFIAAVMFLVVWIAPYWGTASTNYGNVLGTSIEAATVPEWYYTVSGMAGDVTEAFATASMDVFDISQPVMETVAYYQPGVDAVWGAWLELMADPVPTNY